MTASSTALAFGLLLIRLVVGLTMCAHGLDKFLGKGGLARTAALFEMIGIRPARVHAAVAAGTETAAGLLLAVGLLTPFAAAAFVSLMIVGAYTVHLKNGFFITKSGFEYNLVLATVPLGIAATGPGRWSVDHLLGIAGDLSGWPGFALAALLGTLAAAGHLLLFHRPPPRSAR